MKIKIISASKKHVDEWLALRHKLWPKDTYEELEKDVYKILKKRNEKTFLALDDKKVIGFIECSIKTWAHGCKSKRIGYAEGWYVEPEYRRQGVGKLLYKTFFEWAQNKGCAEFASDCYLDNDVSYKAHIAMGFKEQSRLINFVKKI